MKKPIFITVAVTISCLFFVAVGVFAMSLGDVGKVCLFSPISGTITLDGKPAVNARLVRTGDRDGPHVDEAVTNEQGYFEFPGMFERTITKLLPMEFVASQKIMVHYEGNEYEMWSSIKRKREENSESRGKSLVVTCELNWEQKLIVVNGSPIHSLCVWDVEPDPKTDWEKEGFFDK
jgi:hypothetical protein